jgi:hypothetical protein
MGEQPDLFDPEHALHTFSIGIEGSPDLAAAQKVADMIGTVHHGFTFTVQEGLDALFDVIWHIESYEQIRASVPMYILSRKIKALGYKVRSMSWHAGCEPCPTSLPTPHCLPALPALHACNPAAVDNHCAPTLLR